MNKDIKKKEFDENKITGFFDKDTEIKGDMTFRGSFRIDGRFKGTIESDSVLIIGDQGKVEAEVKVGYCVINGEIRGTVRGTERVEIHGRGRVIGTIITPKLVVEEGAFLDANCQSGDQVSPAPAAPKEGEQKSS
jgi:cytoskeletal protein CcmA (bactofilin family)